MARITVEDCLEKINNRFALIHLAAKRVRQLRNGAQPLVESKNKDIVVALREIAAGKVFLLDKEEATLSNKGDSTFPEETPTENPDASFVSESEKETRINDGSDEEV